MRPRAPATSWSGSACPNDGVSLRSAEATGTAAEGETGGRGFWGGLSDLFLPDEDRHAYAEGLSRGGYLLSARVPAGLEDEAVAVLERGDPVDLDERSASWRQSGWTGEGAGYAAASATPGAGAADTTARTGYSTGSAGTATGALGATGAATAGGGEHRAGMDEDAPLQVVEEELRVGKREVGRGSVRVRSYVRERPVEEQVELRQERVTVERRPVDRELRAGDPAFEERTIEAVERGEEAVVDKTARVVEEIGIRKDVERETETVRDTVRKQEVEVEDDRAVTGETLGTGRADLADLDTTIPPARPTR